ncbi:MAG: 50S ribosomal protein L3 [Desulfosudaceae bacterium]
MINGMIGRKLGMTGVFASDGKYVPVTVVKAGPCVVTQIKTTATDGYDALQVGFGEKRLDKVTKPQAGHFQKSGCESGFACVREFAVGDVAAYSPGQEVTVKLFTAGEKVNVAGVTKGRGFAGVIKRHGFSGGRKTHGSRSHRIPGSIGMSAWPGKVIKGKKMPGRYGHVRQTVKNLEIVDVRENENLLLIKGAVPGTRNGLVEINKVAAEPQAKQS